MVLNIIGRHNLKITSGMTDMVEEKLDFLNKFLKEKEIVKLIIDVKNNTQQISIKLSYKHQLIVLEVNNKDFYTGLDKLVILLKSIMFKINDKQINKNKNKQKLFNYYDIKESKNIDNKNIVKRKQFSMKPMMEAEAITQMKSLKHNSFMFINAELNFSMCLLYVRKDGNYGIIESYISNN